MCRLEGKKAFRIKHNIDGLSFRNVFQKYIKTGKDCVANFGNAVLAGF